MLINNIGKYSPYLSPLSTIIMHHRLQTKTVYDLQLDQ